MLLSNNLDSMKPPPSSSWIVGIFGRAKKAILTRFESEQAARTFYEENPNASRVLLLQLKSPGTVASEKIVTKLISCCTAPWDIQGLGVATLLQGGTASDDEIQRQLADGRLPFVPPQRSTCTQNSLKLAMKLFFGRTAVTHFGSAPYRYQSVCHFDVPVATSAVANSPPSKYVALSLDDAPCRFDSRNCSLLTPIKDLLAKYKAKATFMLVGQWCTANHEPDLIALLQDDHELANHGMHDRSYEYDDPVSFGGAVDQCTEIIQNLQLRAGLKPTTPWFRAPHGRYTADMAAQLGQRNMTNVMCDTYASCAIVQDGPFIAQQLLQTVRNGSIILLHMPEVHVRQWCWTALELLLEGLSEQGYRIVTVGQLARISQSGNAAATG